MFWYSYIVKISILYIIHLNLKHSMMNDFEIVIDRKINNLELPDLGRERFSEENFLLQNVVSDGEAVE